MAAMEHDRSRELGDCCGFCLRCGWGRRFMTGDPSSVPDTCPDCGARLRPDLLFGETIRRKPERHRRVDSRRAARDNESTAS